MYREKMQELLEWKNRENRKPMLLKGARQVGKTWLMKEFGRLYYKNVAYISFFKNQRMKELFEGDFDLERILANISIETKTRITPQDTLIIFDEIQEAPRALESLKVFCEEAKDYHIIAAGSLLGVALHSGISFPVGKINMLDLYPLNYCEFLEAVGESALAEIIRTKQYVLLKDFADKLTFKLKEYFYVGGMPEIVDNFSKNKDYIKVRKLQKEILQQYAGDFSKHCAGSLARINMLWQAIPVQLAKENKKFFFGQVKEGGRLKDFELAIEWLVASGLITRVHRVTKPNIPLKAYVELNVFKLFMLDIGLLGALSDLDATSIITGNDIFVEFKGALTEQFVLQEMVSSTEYIPYYYLSKSGKYEIDFIIQKGHAVVPLEVKAGINVKAKSLKFYCEKIKPSYAFRVSLQPYRKEDNLVNIPLFAVRTI